MKSIVFLLMVISCGSFAQRIKQPEIQYITLSDTFLIAQIKDVIEVAKKRYPLFRENKGYLGLALDYVNKTGTSPDRHMIDTLSCFVINTSHLALDGEENTLGDAYMPYYTKVNGRLVLINDKGLAKSVFGFSPKSKIRLKKKVESFLEKPGSKSRTVVNLDWQRKIYYLKDLTTGKILPPHVVDEVH